MDIRIEIPLNASVYCQESKIGKSIELVIDPEDQLLTHLVVLENFGKEEERLVPIGWISAIHADKLILGCTRSELARMDIFCKRDVVMQQQSGTMPDYAKSMYNYPITRRVLVENKAVPEGKFSFDGNTFIFASDGRAGKLDRFLVSADSKCITHLVMKSAALFNPRECFIPIDSIERVKDQVIYLNLTKDEIHALNAVPA